jgi:tetratricopeptide (TPR) repeat protein
MLVADGKLEPFEGTYRPTGELGDLAVPETLRSLIASRLDALEPADRSLLQDASVLGQRFTLPALAAVCATDSDALEARLRNLARREFVDIEVDPRSPERGQYGFVQSLIREVAYGTLAKRDRRARHLAAARYYEALGEDELAGALAGHYLAAHEASADGAERDAIAVQARRALRGAAERAASLGAHAQAVSFLTQALTVTTDDRERAALLELRADSANPSGQHELAEASARQAVNLYREAGDEFSSLRASALLGRILIDIGKLHDAGPTLEEALGLRATQTDDVATAAVLAVLARVYMRTNENERAIAAADRALRVAEHDGARDIIAEALVNKGTSLGALGRRHEGRVLLQAAVDLAGELGMSETQLRGLNNLSSAWLEDDPRRALATVLNGVALAERIGQSGIMNWQIGTSAMFSVSLGEDWAAPVARLEEMLSRQLTSHDQARAAALLALYRVLQGIDAREAIADARQASAKVDEVQIAAIVEWGNALESFFDRDYAGVIAAVDRLTALWANFSMYAWTLGARAAANSGRRADFDRYRSLMEASTQAGAIDNAGRAWVAAMGEAVDGRADEAAAHLAETAADVDRLGFKEVAAEFLVDAVRLSPETPAAKEWSARARATFERLDARPYLALLDEVEAAARAAQAKTPGAERRSESVAASSGPA